MNKEEADKIQKRLGKGEKNIPCVVSSIRAQGRGVIINITPHTPFQSVFTIKMENSEVVEIAEMEVEEIQKKEL